MNTATARTSEAGHPFTGPGTAPLTDAWKAWLDERINPAWRPGEWDQDRLLFTGDPDNPRTSLHRCAVHACNYVSTARMCTGCSKAHKKSSVPLEEFLASHIPGRTKLAHGEVTTCIAAHGRCQRDARDGGLCTAHGPLWRYHQGRAPHLDRDAWLAGQEPFERKPRCAITGCAREETQPNGICVAHMGDWRDYRKQNDTPDTASERDVWMRRTPPRMKMSDFSLWPVSDVVRSEILYALQQRDERGQNIEPVTVRYLVRNLADVPSIAFMDEDAVTALVDLSPFVNRKALIHETRQTLMRGLDELRGIDPSERYVWDLRAVGIPSKISSVRSYRNTGSIDFGEIRIPWLRDVALDWARAYKPYSASLRRTIKACQLAADTLARQPGGGTDMTKLRFADMSVIADAFRNLSNDDGTPLAPGTRRAFFRHFHEVLDHGRANDLLAGMPAAFGKHKAHRIADVEQNEDELGKAIPESVLRQLDAHTHLLGVGIPYGELAEDDVRELATTAYVILRDTGRRPREVAELRYDCLEWDGDDCFLIWDNIKGGRKRRRLPITQDTAAAIEKWRSRRKTLLAPAKSDGHLFPAKGAMGANRALGANDLAVFIRRFADSIPELHSEAPGPDGNPLPFDRSLIFPYAFRFSYAQRHADAGVPIDVLKELMDHKSIQTTQGYYKVSLKRKREAVKSMRLQVVDRHGQPAPMASSTAYELRSVAVPFGNCQEPSNVKAGGKACPIRFQCAGCGFYRPDPSYLPAIEDHVRALKAKRETALAMDTAEFVIRNMDDEIAAFRGVVDVMHQHLDQMPDAERGEIEEASRILRKVRAAAGPTLLGMPAMPHQRDETAP